MKANRIPQETQKEQIETKYAMFDDVCVSYNRTATIIMPKHYSQIYEVGYMDQNNSS